MRYLWKFTPLLSLGLVLGLIFVPQSATQSQVARAAAHGTPSVSSSQTDENLLPVNQVDLFLEDPTVYLPLVIKAAGGTPPPSDGSIYGTVTAIGEPAASIDLTLWYDTDILREPITTTTTLSDGSYAFTDVPSLNVGESYYAVYMNAITPEFLNYYRTPKLNSYTAGTNVYLSDFDIGNIDLISPEDFGIETVPVEFTWNVRPEMTTDSYKLVIHNITSLDIIYESEKLGYVGLFRINDISEVPMVLDVKYLWEIWVYRPDGGNGISYEWWEITFSK